MHSLLNTLLEHLEGDIVSQEIAETEEECRENLADALKEMIAAYQQLGKEMPTAHFLIEPLAVEV